MFINSFMKRLLGRLSLMGGIIDGKLK